MRILAVTNLYPNPNQPNRAAFNRQQFRALAEEHEVHVIAPIAWTGRWRGARKADAQLPTHRTRMCDGMIIHHPTYYFTPKILLGWYGRFFLQSVRACFYRAATEFQPDVVLGCWAYPDGWAAVQLARELNLPVAVKVHGSDVLTVGDGVRCKRTVEALRGADAVIAVSRHLAQQVISMGVDKRRVHVVYNGVDTRLFTPGSQSEARKSLKFALDQKILLFVGNLVDVKGLDVLINALASLAHAGVAFQCRIIGEGALRNELLAQIARHNLHAQVQLMGSIPLDQLPLWYRAVDLLVLPSRSEGIPNVLLEAAACGTHFLASAVGGIPEIAPAESLLPPDDAGALSQRIRSALLRASPAQTQPFQPTSWNASADSVAHVLRNILANSLNAKAS